MIFLNTSPLLFDPLHQLGYYLVDTDEGMITMAVLTGHLAIIWTFWIDAYVLFREVMCAARRDLVRLVDLFM